MAERRYIWVIDQRGTRLPFSKGTLVTSVTATGVTPQQAYGVAEAVEDTLFGQDRDLIHVDELVGWIEKEIARQLGSPAAEAWSSWVDVRRRGDPIIVLIGGATGVGKSTVASRLAARLGISQVVATDGIREVTFAAETAALTRAQILVQSGTTVLSIANQNPANVLALLQ